LMSNEQWYIVDSFSIHGKHLVHAESLPNSQLDIGESG
jgi:hypothetical protein